ncbi:glycosyl transferase family 2 [Desulfovibrio sp. X2]|uniref:glycosyltransferase family 2 protein n=1 Tax=Desulfovibrio sp. X2 TaxID=941449 RepID=UPI0003588279|nr:glycosyltransferase family 2 protein [Desulfovibrio sp. X2]EPR41212.1 glycosyl transferase family 2 [Desulfovibrio sp. X2]
MRQPITAVVLTFNGQRLLRQCLESLAFCDEILVVDSGSTDETLAIAAEFKARVLTRAWEGTIPQFTFAFEHVQTPWIITLDQDEVLSPELRENVLSRLENPGNACGFWVRRSSFYFERFMGHSGWYPDWLFRVFRADGYVLQGTLPHEEFRPKGEAPRLQADIIHYPYEDLAEHLRKISSYTKTAAEIMYARGKRCGVTGAIFRALGRFVKKYVFKRGFLDGRAGFVLALYDMLYVFQKYLLLEEMRVRERQGRKEP